MCVLRLAQINPIFRRVCSSPVWRETEETGAGDDWQDVATVSVSVLCAGCWQKGSSFRKTNRNRLSVKFYSSSPLWNPTKGCQLTQKWFEECLNFVLLILVVRGECDNDNDDVNIWRSSSISRHWCIARWPLTVYLLWRCRAGCEVRGGQMPLLHRHKHRQENWSKPGWD